MRRTGGEVSDDRDAIGGGEGVGGFRQRHRVGGGGCGNVDSASGGHLDVMVQLCFLQAGVVNHIDRSLARAHHDRVGARKSAWDAVDGSRLVIPFDEIADRFALAVGRMNRVDERAALGLAMGPVAPMIKTGARSR